jgi:hypothetical protein
MGVVSGSDFGAPASQPGRPGAKNVSQRVAQTGRSFPMRLSLAVHSRIFFFLEYIRADANTYRWTKRPRDHVVNRLMVHGETRRRHHHSNQSSILCERMISLLYVGTKTYITTQRSGLRCNQSMAFSHDGNDDNLQNFRNSVKQRVIAKNKNDNPAPS